MLRIRPGLKARFRNVSAEEYAVLAECAEERGSLPLEERAAYGVPEAADDSIVGAILWSTFVLWQDHPSFLALGLAGGGISIVVRAFDLLK
jgi:hypothetical protein